MDERLREALVGDWGRLLLPREFQDAIVTAGLAEGVLAERQRWGLSALEPIALLNEVRAKAVLALDEGQYVGWVWPSPETVDVLPAKEAYAAITRLPVRVAIQSPPLEMSASALLQPLVQTIARPSSRVNAFIEALGPGDLGYGLVSWPLRIGFAEDLQTSRIREALDQMLSHPELIEPVDAYPCDVLVTGAPMSDLLSDGIELSGDLTLGSEVDPERGLTLVVVVGDMDIDGSDADALARSIMSQTTSGGVHLCACGAAAGAAWLNQLIEHLSHDKPVDRALMAADDWLYGVGFSLLSPYTVETLRLSYIVDQIKDWFWAQSDLDIELPESIRNRLPGFPPVERATSGEIADYLCAHADQFQYDHESEEATGIAGIVRAAGGFPDQVIWGAGPLKDSSGAKSTFIKRLFTRIQEAVYIEAVPEVVGELGPRWLGADVIVDGHLMERAFVAGVPNLVRVTIGRSATHQADVGLPEPDFEEMDEVDLPVWARVGESVHDGTITLPRDRRRDATKPFEFEVTPTSGEPLAIEIVVYQPDGHDVLQAALISGDAADSLTDEATSPESISVAVVGVQSFTGAPAAAPRESIVHSASGGLVRSAGEPVPIAIDAEAARQWTTDTVAAIEKGAAGQEMLDIPIEKLLIQLAGRGAVRLSTLPELLPLVDSPRIQVVSLVRRDVFPIEFLYSGPKPLPGAHLCADWRKSLRSDECPTCTVEGPLDGSTVCPFQFWSMSKVIEHHGLTGEPSATFSVTGFRTLEQGEIGPLEPVLVGVSDSVLEVDPTALTDLADAVGGASLATDWTDWTELVEQTNPGLLIAMPHQETINEFGTEEQALELGGQFESSFSEAHVTHRAAPPGPIVLLLGCSTAVGGGHAFSSFASTFRAYGASLVVSSLGEVIAIQAPLAASAFLRHLTDVLKRPGGTLGEALLQTKRALLSEGKLLPLMLVNHGDPDWSMES